MKKIVYILTILTASILTYGQEDIDKLTKPIVDEGKRLYKSEMASWRGTDLFLEQFKEGEKIGGYFSYTDNEMAKCIFFSKGESPKVIGTISFDSTYDTKIAKMDLIERDFSKFEYDLFVIRSSALRLVNSDTLFKTYKNTNLNLIPLISKDERKVYILTGPTQSGVVIFGNDYLITFDNENNLISKRQLHKNIISVYYNSKELEGKGVEGTMHSHLPETGDFITATDICTLMLYEKFAKWEQHTVVSKNYVSIWDCQTDELVTITREAMDKIYKNQEKRRKKDKDKKD